MWRMNYAVCRKVTVSFYFVGYFAVTHTVSVAQILLHVFPSLTLHRLWSLCVGVLCVTCVWSNLKRIDFNYLTNSHFRSICQIRLFPMRGSVDVKNGETGRRNVRTVNTVNVQIEVGLSESVINHHQQLSMTLLSTCLIDDFIWKIMLQKLNFLLF